MYEHPKFNLDYRAASQVFSKPAVIIQNHYPSTRKVVSYGWVLDAYTPTVESVLDGAPNCYTVAIFKIKYKNCQHLYNQYVLRN